MTDPFRFRVLQHGPAGTPVGEAFLPAEPRPGQVRLALRAMALNYLDLWTTEGIPGARIPLPITPGCDGAGVIEAERRRVVGCRFMGWLFLRGPGVARGCRAAGCSGCPRSAR